MQVAVPFLLYPGEIQVLKSRKWKSTADFAEQDYVVVAGPHKGRNYNHEIYPYGRWIMDLWDMASVRTLYLIAPSQTGKTTIAYVCLCSEISRNPSSAGVGMPDEDTMKRIFEEKLGPSFKKSKALRELLVDKNQKPIQAGKILTQFGAVYGMYAGSDASASSVSLRIIIVDEEDAYLDKQAAPRMVERNISYEDESKTLRASKLRGSEKQSTIWRDMKNDAQIIYQIRAVCPNCGTPQVMEQERIKVPGNMRDPKAILQQRAAWYECIGCSMRWNDHYRNLAVQRGHLWAEQEVPNPTAVGVIIPSWYSRTVSLSKVMADWFTALDRGTPAAMAWFDNSHACKPYKVVTIKAPKDQVRMMILHDRPAREVPAEAIAMTMGVDSQKTGFYFVVRAWAKSGESWLIDYGFLGSKADLDQQRKATYPVEGREDVVMGLWRVAIDFGGTRDESHAEGWSRSEEVKLMVMEADDDSFMAVKGASRKQEMVVRRSETGVHRDVPKEYQENIIIYTLDTVELKDLIWLVRLKHDSLQPMWLHREVGEDYIRQMCAEEREEDGKGNPTWSQIKKRPNHLFDCEVYAAACAHPDWTPALQTLPEPQYISVYDPSDSYEDDYRPSPLAGRILNPNFRR
ncbi:terminase gpA endonuclease subunit [Maridesulfovibrio sp.]|uniref:terminase gpA endonuclease subunit n=1 Tax=Maridesulfovibrio sp. TaxID=2795000 RepID=UPI003AFF9F59